MNQGFINDAFAKALVDYQNSCDKPKGITYNSFLVVVIRALVCLYGELDIINPFIAQDEDLLVTNLSKFGYSKENIAIFFANLNNYYQEELKNNNRKVKIKNPYFIMVQKNLVDMLIAKKLNFYLTEVEVKEFYDLLYTPHTTNPLRLSYNYLMAENTLEVDEYFKKQMKDNVKVVLPVEKHFLNVRAYEILNYNIEDLMKLDSAEIDKINTQIFDFFKIRENAINKEYLLEKAIEAYDNEANKVTSGNGYVDILLVISIICTIMMLVGIVAFILI